MPKILRYLGCLLQAIVLTTLVLFAPVLLSHRAGLATPMMAFHEDEFISGKKPSSSPPPIPFSAPTLGTFQNFDLPNTGTPYVTNTYFPSPATPAAIIPGGPTGLGKLMRLAFADSPIPTENGITFDQTN